MNAIQHLQKEHAETRALFHQFNATAGAAYQQRQAIAVDLLENIIIHSELEEKILFPAWQAKGGEEAAALVLQGIEEHRMAELMIDRLQKTCPEDRTFAPRFNALVGSFRHHLTQEACQIFPKAKQDLAGDLERLGEEMAALERDMRLA